MRKKIHCPYCDHEWEIGYWKWVLTAPFHLFDFIEWKERRKIRCPKCGIKSWVSRGK